MMIFWWWFKRVQFPTSQTNSLMLLKSWNLWGPLKTHTYPQLFGETRNEGKNSKQLLKVQKEKKREEKHREFSTDSPVAAVTSCYNCYVSFSRILTQRLQDQVC